MSSPSHHTSHCSLSSGGPSRSVLHRLLEEINGDSGTTTTSDEFGQLYSLKSRDSSVADYSRCHSTSVWLDGEYVADDARNKLRAMDEAHQRKQADKGRISALPSVFPQQHDSVLSNVEALATRPHHGRASSPSFLGVQFRASSTSPTLDMPSPSSEQPEVMIRRISSLFTFNIANVMSSSY